MRTMVLLALLAVFVSVGTGSAQVYRWDTGEVIPNSRVPTLYGYVRGPSLAYADLEGLNFQGAYVITSLQSAHLMHCDVTDAYFNGVDLTNADLTGAKLTSCRFRDCVLTGADLTNSVLQDASFHRITGFTAEQLYRTASYKQGNLKGIAFNDSVAYWDFSGQDLTDAHFGYVKLNGANFSGATINGAALFGFGAGQLCSTASYQTGDLRRVYLQRSTFINCDFSGKDLTEASLRECTLTGAKFVAANLNGTDLSEATLNDADFRQADLTDAELWNATLQDVDLTDAVITGANFNRTGLAAKQLYSTASYRQGRLAGVRLSGNMLSGWDFSGKDLSGCLFCRSDLTGTDFTDAGIVGVNFGHTTDSGFTSGQLYATKSYKDGDLTGVILSDNDLSGWDFSGQDLTGAVFGSADLTDADFSGAVIAGVDLYDATGFTIEQLCSTASYQMRDLHGLRTSEIDLTGCDFSGMDLTGAFLAFSRLADVDFTDAIVNGTIFSDDFTPAQLYSTRSYKQANLSGIGLACDSPGGCDLAGMDLTGAFVGGMFLASVDLSSAVIRNAGFHWDDDFPLTPEQFYSTASYQDRELGAIWLGYNDLSGWDLSNQNMRGAYLENSDLSNTNFSGADLAGANLGNNTRLTRINLRMANLTDVVFGYGDFWNSDLSGSDARGSNLTSWAYDEVRYLSNHIYPNGHVTRLWVMGETMPIWDYDGEIDITVDELMRIDGDGALKLVFEDAEWGSTIRFKPGAEVVLRGTLELVVADGVEVSNLFGTTFDIFDWTGVEPVGSLHIAGTLKWDTSELYTTGRIKLIGFDSPMADFAVFAQQWLTEDCTEPDYCNGADFDGSGKVDMRDLCIFSEYWRYGYALWY